MGTVDPEMEVMLETFIHETETMLEQLDNIMIESERAKSLSEENINDIFRITHTIKGSAAMMSFDDISNLAHAVEDVFYVLREDPAKLSLVFDALFDLVLSSSDFLKAEVEKLQTQGDYQEDDPSELIGNLHQQAAILSGTPEEGAINTVTVSTLSGDNVCLIRVFFEDDCQMENMRAFMLLTQLQHECDAIDSIPQHPENSTALSAEIIKNGFLIICKPINSVDEVLKSIENALNIKSYELLEENVDIGPVQESNDNIPATSETSRNDTQATQLRAGVAKQSLISVNQKKLDHLMDLVGELVTAESMVAHNPDLEGLRLDNFANSLRDLRKLTDELQDIVMSIRMVPLQSTFHKMDRIVRDMNKKLDKKVELVTEGGDTEVDKTITDAIADPLMHMIRNSMDHAIESPEERLELNKRETGRITLAAKNVGGEIHITVADDGCGLIAEKLLNKARQNGLLIKPESEYTEKEAFALIMLPGFSTNAEVTEFSGRGVGMDVVRKNLEQVGGTISISSKKDMGTTFTIKIPLTLAIMDGMNISVGQTVFTLPITSINQSFKITSPEQILHNTNGSEMIVRRGECYPILRLGDYFGIEANHNDMTDGILIQVESSSTSACLYADELLGEYQVVVKPFPPFFNKYNLKECGLAGCSILGDGIISLILDANNLLTNL